MRPQIDPAKVRFMRHYFQAYLASLEAQHSRRFFNFITGHYFETFGYAPMNVHFDGTREEEDRLLSKDELVARLKLIKRVRRVRTRPSRDILKLIDIPTRSAD